MFSFKPPNLPLPISSSQFASTESYVDSLLDFATTSSQLQTLCGGVHILDFFTRSPDLYSAVLPDDWREWFERVEIYDLLDLILRHDLDEIISARASNFKAELHSESEDRPSILYDGETPPTSLLDFIIQVRRHALVTDFEPLPLPDRPSKQKAKGPYTPSLQAMLQGMNPKKKHEVTNFARYVTGLADSIGGISHIVDFGAGANYLGRNIASEPYNKHVIAVESS